MRVALIVPNKDGRRWLPGMLASVRAQSRAADRVVVVDDGSRDDSVAWLRSEGVEVLERGASGGFAAAVNAGWRFVGADCDAIALVNTDVELAPDWLERTTAALAADDGAAAVACKMVGMDDAGLIDDAGDILRRDGVCEQRGHGRRDDGRWDAPGEVFAACAGAALYRRAAVLAAGGFDERLFASEEIALSKGLAKHGRFIILRERVLTSGRKLRTHSGWDVLKVLAHLVSSGGSVLRSRDRLSIWYGARRDDV